VIHLLLLLATTAQQSAVCSFDTAAHTRTDSITIALAPGWDRRPRRKAPNDFMDAAQMIGGHFRAPAQVRLPLWARTMTSSDSMRQASEHIGYGLDGELRFWLDESGRVTYEPIELRASSPDVVASIVAAIWRADSSAAFAPPSTDVRRGKGAIQLRMVNAAHSAGPSVPLLRIVVPALVVDSAPALVSIFPLEYPPEARRARAGDRVILELVIGADGRPDTASIHLVQARYREFAEEAVRRLKAARFRPAWVAGCPVPTLVRIPFEFRMRR
jgi:TonB family protein